MNTIIELNNTIKYDFKKCTQCLKCVNICPSEALHLINNQIELNEEKCLACKNCINLCETKALYYNINSGYYEGNNVVAIIPFDADIRFINKKYSDVISYELGEKVKVIETSFEMENLTSRKILDGFNNPLIVSDILNIDLILKNKYPHIEKYLSKVKNNYYISSYLCRMLNNNKNIKIVSYAVPFEIKNYFHTINIIDEICDIPFKSNNKYNIMDILNTYMSLCKLESDVDISEFTLFNSMVINLKNKNLSIKVLLIKDVDDLASIEILNYDFIFICKNDTYKINENILKDKEINQLYKNKLKVPGKTNALYKKG